LLQARLIEAQTRKGPFKSSLQQCDVKSLAVKRRGAQNNLFLPTHKERGGENMVPF